MLHFMVITSAAFFGTAFLSAILAHYANVTNYFGKANKTSMETLRVRSPYNTQAEIYPHVQSQTRLSTPYIYAPATFSIKMNHHKCEMLVSAMNRFSETLAVIYDEGFTLRVNANFSTTKRPKTETDSRKSSEKKEKSFLYLKELQLVLRKPCENAPHPDMDENYFLTVSSTIVLSSETVWGIMRGLETLGQLFYVHKKTGEVRINATYITDYPLYPHRGLMLDTANTYVPVEDILITLDAMAMNKMNVFHWHIVDDHSFPYQSKKFPEFSNKSTSDPSKVYTIAQILKIIDYAKNLGIRVYPEFSIPGRTYSWRMAHPEIVTTCLKNMRYHQFGPLHPLLETTYNIIQELFREVQTVFTDKYFHIGGDGVDFTCWFLSEKIKNFSLNNKLTMLQVEGMFMEKVSAFFDNNTQVVVMQDVFETGYTVKNEIVQVSKLPWQFSLVNIVTKDLKAIVSAPWKLDDSRNTFKVLYQNADPRAAVHHLVHDKHLNHILGGEAVVWTNRMVGESVHNITWPGALAVAELLWSGNHETSALFRAREQVQRMRRRGIPIANNPTWRKRKI